MLFNFRLRPVCDIDPFGDCTLHWYGLTDGWYWISVGDDELFRYNRQFLETWTPPPAQPYVDYHIGRLWEDLLAILPNVLDPVPSGLADKVAPAAEWKDWLNRAREWTPDSDDDHACDLWYSASAWWALRRLDTGYLRWAPHVWFWRVGDRVNIRWDNSDAVENGVTVWQTVSGEVSLSLSDFLREVNGFHGRFMTGMARRVEEACHHWERSDVYIDFATLASEHPQRAQGLARSLNMPPGTGQEHNWAEIVEAIDKLDTLMKSAG